MAMVSISKVLKSMVDKNITMEGKTEKISPLMYILTVLFILKYILL